jgi:hypothetical protein
VASLSQTVVKLAQTHQISALNISGGEPMEQAVSLKAALTIIRHQGIHDILVYTGFWAKDLLERHDWLPDLVSALVDGPYEARNPSPEIFRGSTNQNLWLFDSTLASLYQTWSRQTKRQAQILALKCQIRLLGVLGPHDYEPVAAAIDQLASPPRDVSTGIDG